MMNGWGMTGWGWTWMGLWILISVAIVTLLAVALIRGSRPDQRSRVDQDALAILKQRYARGEIDEAKFQRRLEILTGER
jgi:putative membrane protein